MVRTEAPYMLISYYIYVYVIKSLKQTDDLLFVCPSLKTSFFKIQSKWFYILYTLRGNVSVFQFPGDIGNSYFPLMFPWFQIVTSFDLQLTVTHSDVAVIHIFVFQDFS